MSLSKLVCGAHRQLLCSAHRRSSSVGVSWRLIARTSCSQGDNQENRFSYIPLMFLFEVTEIFGLLKIVDLKGPSHPRFPEKFRLEHVKLGLKNC